MVSTYGESYLGIEVGMAEKLSFEPTGLSRRMLSTPPFPPPVLGSLLCVFFFVVGHLGDTYVLFNACKEQLECLQKRL